MATDQPPAFGEALRRHRLAAGLTQQALAERAGLSVRGIADLERGVRRAPYANTVRRLGNALGLGEAERAARAGNYAPDGVLLGGAETAGLVFAHEQPLDIGGVANFGVIFGRVADHPTSISNAPEGTRIV